MLPFSAVHLQRQTTVPQPSNIFAILYVTRKFLNVFTEFVIRTNCEPEEFSTYLRILFLLSTF